MTAISSRPALPAVTAQEIIGPFSPWPRRKPRGYKRPATLLASFAGLGVFAHCVLPMIA